MSAIRRLSNRLYGAAEPRIHRWFSQDIDLLVEELLDNAAGLWQENGWKRFSDHELNCTLQMFRWTEEAKKSRLEFRVLTIQLEWVQPTPAMLAGDESAVGMGRPDFRVTIGQEAGRTIECKRLSLGADHPRIYVNKGVDRFISGDYGRGEPRGVMLGYLQADDPENIVEVINRVIDQHPRMGQSHRLSQIQASPRIPWRYGSSHTRPSELTIALDHYVIDLRPSVAPLNSQTVGA